MAPEGQHSHRPTQKQTNKSFKSKHASKGSLKDASKGRTHRPMQAIKSNPKQTNAMISAAHHKLNRRNHAKQLQAKKEAELETMAKLFMRKGQDKVARVVAVVPMTDDVDPAGMVASLLGSVGVDCNGEGAVRTGDVVKFHNQSLRFLLLPPASDPESTFAVLDGCTTADFVLIGLSSDQEVDRQGETVLRCMTGSGVGASGGVLGVVQSLPDHITLASSTRSSLHSFLTHFFPTVERIQCSAIASEASTAIRSLCDKVPKGLRWREARPRVLAERLEWHQEGDEQGFGTLRIEGVVRGARLAADRLVHLQGFGDFKVDKITAAPAVARPRKGVDAMETGPTPLTADALALLSAPTDDADSLASTNVPDPEDLLLGEQTWPTEEEMAQGGAGSSRIGEMLPPALPGTTPRLKRVPKGTSTYQAAWIIDEEAEDGDWDEDEEAEEGMDGSEIGSEEETEFVDQAAEDTMTVASARPFADLDPEQEEAQLKMYLAERARQRALENRDDLDFPDERDTPLDIPARERFARYRGMKSFRTSPWDPYEELPIEYSRCFMFEDFKQMGRKMERKAQLEGVEPGTRVVVHIKGVPEAAYTQHKPEHPFVIFGLLKHEHKYSVMHFTVQRNTEYDDPVRSKDPLVVMIGPRRFVINPIFSAHTVRGNGKGANNVHKFERYLRHGINATIATAYLPITFGNAPAVLLRVPGRPEDEGRIELVGTGSLLSSDPTRITAKRIILTGHPFKVHKKTATIRYMFFNQPDIDYFKPVQLRTKRGRVGHIRESLGTHGYFKAGFDGPIDQMEQIMLTLYKRCFPKWGKVWDGGLVGAPKMYEVEAAAEARLGDVEMQ